MNLSKSFEDYIETIYLIKEFKGVVRVKDVAKNLKVKMPSVTGAIKKLSDLDLVVYKKYGLIKLTKKGENLAKDVYKKHDALFVFLTRFLGVTKEVALEEACAIEHNISESTLKKLKKFIVRR